MGDFAGEFALDTERYGSCLGDNERDVNGAGGEGPGIVAFCGAADHGADSR